MTLTPTSAALDQGDERLQVDEGFGGGLRSFWRSVKAGDVGVLPVVVGLIVICTIFQSLNPVFLSSANLVNLALDSCAVGIISLGIVCVLLVGEIDLSVGSVSGFSGAIVGVLFVRHGWNWVLAVALACAVAVLIGLLYGVLLTRFGMPSFVASLSGLLAFLGLQLAILGDQGSVNLPFDSTLVQFAQVAFVPQWLSYVLAALAGIGLFLTGYETRQRRRNANLSAQSMNYLVARSVALAVGLAVFVWYLNQERGVGWMVVLFVVLVLVSTTASRARSGVAACSRSAATRRPPAGRASTYGGSTSAPSLSARSWHALAASSRPPGSPRRTCPAAPATSTSTPSRLR